MARTTLGSLVVVLTGNTKPLTRALKTAQRRMSRFAAKTARLSASMGRLGLLLVAPLAGAVVMFTRAGDAASKMARRTGLSVEAVQRLGFAAGIAGAQMEDVEKGIKRMAKTIVDAGDGMATYVRAFERIGVSVKDLEGLSPEMAFRKLAEAIRLTEDPILRAAAAQDIFGRAGTKLIPLFEEGEAGLERLAIRAQRLNIIMGAESTENAAKLADAFFILKQGMVGVARAITESLGIPFDTLGGRITSVIERVVVFVKKNGEWIKRMAKLGVQLLVAAVALKVLSVAASVAAVGIGALVAVILAAPVIAWGIAIAVGATYLMLMSDALGLTNIGVLEFLQNIKVGGVRIKAWAQVVLVLVAGVFDTLVTRTKIAVDTVATAFRVLGLKIKGSLQTVIGIAVKQLTKFLDKLIAGVNKVIGGLNHIRGVNIPKIEISGEDLSKGFDAAIKESFADAERLSDQLAGRTGKSLAGLAQRIAADRAGIVPIIGADIADKTESSFEKLKGRVQGWFKDFMPDMSAFTGAAREAAAEAATGTGDGAAGAAGADVTGADVTGPSAKKFGSAEAFTLGTDYFAAISRSGERTAINVEKVAAAMPQLATALDAAGLKQQSEERSKAAMAAVEQARTAHETRKAAAKTAVDALKEAKLQTRALREIYGSFPSLGVIGSF